MSGSNKDEERLTRHHTRKDQQQIIASILERDEAPALPSSCDVLIAGFDCKRGTRRPSGSRSGLQEYVIVHELAHLVERDHSAAFWSRVGRALPDYEQRRAALKRLGPELVW